jgi:uncharacterized membrane protein
MAKNDELRMEKHRLELFSDAVFAIIITLLVIEMKVPENPDILSNSDLVHSLSEMTSLLYSYFLSAAVVSSIWIGHHFIYQFQVKNIDRWVIQLNTLLLVILALMPFSAALLGRYPTFSISLQLYGINILAVYLVNFVLVEYIWRSDNIENGEITSRVRKQGKIRLYISISCTVLALLFSTFNSGLAITFYIIPLIFSNIPGILNAIEKLFGFRIE